MCELFAINARSPQVANDYLRTFYSHSVEHPDGWGLSWRENGAIRLVKEPVRAVDSQLLAELLEQPLAARNMVGHIRKATHGIHSYENCHPFVEEDVLGTEWCVAHNGIVVNDDLLAGYTNWETGQTDSECVVLFLLDVLEEAERRNNGRLDFDLAFYALAAAISQLSVGNLLNLVISDGTCTYVHTNSPTPTLHYLQKDEAVIVSTQPLDDGPWQPVPSRRLVAFCEGQLVRMAPEHCNVCHSAKVLRDYVMSLREE